MCALAYLKAHKKSQPDDMIPKFLNQQKRLEEARVSVDVFLLSSHKDKERERRRVEGRSERKK